MGKSCCIISLYCNCRYQWQVCYCCICLSEVKCTELFWNSAFWCLAVLINFFLISMKFLIHMIEKILRSTFKFFGAVNIVFGCILNIWNRYLFIFNSYFQFSPNRDINWKTKIMQQKINLTRKDEEDLKKIFNLYYLC